MHDPSFGSGSHFQNAPQAPSRNPTRVPHLTPSTSTSTPTLPNSRLALPAITVPSQGPTASIKKTLHFFSRDEGEFCMFTQISATVPQTVPELDDPDSTELGALFVHMSPGISEVKVWIRAHDGWRVGFGGNAHPTMPHRRLSIRNVGVKTEPNWVLLKSYQKYQQEELRARRVCI